MRVVLRALAVVMVAGMAGGVALADPPGDYVVSGVEGEDLLKMRAGPGVGYRVILGLPNGTVLRIQSCEQTGSTRWCKASLKEARAVRGYVSWAYLQER